jgi:hypothetical protein
MNYKTPKHYCDHSGLAGETNINQGLINAADKAQKKRNKIASKNKKTHVINKKAFKAQLRLKFKIY